MKLKTDLEANTIKTLKEITPSKNYFIEDRF